MNGNNAGITPRVRAISLRIAADTVEEHAPHLTGECEVIRSAAAEIERLAAERDAAWQAVEIIQRANGNGGNV